MIKKFLILLNLSILLNAGLNNAVAIVVNEKAITLYDIDETMNRDKLSRNQAVVTLIDKILYEQEIKKFKLDASKYEINEYLNNLALSNGMELKYFKKVVKKQQNYIQFWNQIKKRIINQKLVNKIAVGQLKIANQEDMRLYYENNIQQFKIKKNSIEVYKFEQVRNKIFNIIMIQREKKFLKEYFETLKITANIVVLR
jgi:PIN domain nuclease of toxin-antitoxin system